jgi:hypothetical protein
MSKLETNTIDTISGSTTLTLGGTNANAITIPSGVTLTNNGTQAGLTLSDNILFNTASKGIYLGVTSATASNLLDDYEEGLHTVTATDTGGGATIVMNTSYDQLAYTKIGRVVHIQGVLLFSSITGAFTGTLQISLPFTSSNLTDLAGRTVMGLGTYNVDFTSGTAPYLNVPEAEAHATIQVSGDNVTGGEGRPQASAQLYIGGSYVTDA